MTASWQHEDLWYGAGVRHWPAWLQQHVRGRQHTAHDSTWPLTGQQCGRYCWWYCKEGRGSGCSLWSDVSCLIIQSDCVKIESLHKMAAKYRKWRFNWKQHKYVVSNRPFAQIPQCTSSISHNAPFCNRNVHMCAHFLCTFLLQNGALCDNCMMHYGICKMGLLKIDLRYCSMLYL